ncbi:MAG: DUF368 domain-containing protein [Clostridia bacterium]|nr:DUF368 domain-containing protein [Clostridia bacterium]
MIKKNNLLEGLVWIAQGILVGFGAILPGVSGGALLAAFRLYKPVMDIISSCGKCITDLFLWLFGRRKNTIREIIGLPISTIRQYFSLFCFFGFGGLVGFVGLSGLVNVLLETNEILLKCVFIGFMLGTVPELWSDAGKTVDKARYPLHRPSHWLGMAVGFAGMMTLLLLLNGSTAVQITPGFAAYLFCGLCWGLSFVVPGMSASTLLLFFGLYGPMLDGISRLAMSVCIPLGIGMVLVLLLLPRMVNAAFARWDAVLSHGILGIVLATTVMIFPGMPEDTRGLALYAICIVSGCAVSYLLGRLCAKLHEKAEQSEA